MNEIRELAGRLDSLTGDETANLSDLVKAKAAEVGPDDESDEATQVLGELADIADRISAASDADVSEFLDQVSEELT
jgi:hypothetical protein